MFGVRLLTAFQQPACLAPLAAADGPGMLGGWFRGNVCSKARWDAVGTVFGGGGSDETAKNGS